MNQKACFRTRALYNRAYTSCHTYIRKRIISTFALLLPHFTALHCTALLRYVLYAGAAITCTQVQTESASARGHTRGNGLASSGNAHAQRTAWRLATLPACRGLNSFSPENTHDLKGHSCSKIMWGTFCSACAWEYLAPANCTQRMRCPHRLPPSFLPYTRRHNNAQCVLRTILLFISTHRHPAQPMSVPMPCPRRAITRYVGVHKIQELSGLLI